MRELLEMMTGNMADDSFLFKMPFFADGPFLKYVDKQGGGGRLAKYQQYSISLYSKLVNEGFKMLKIPAT